MKEKTKVSKLERCRDIIKKGNPLNKENEVSVEEHKEIHRKKEDESIQSI